MFTGYLKDIRVSAPIHNGLSISLYLTRSHQYCSGYRMQNVTLLERFGLIEIELCIGLIVIWWRAWNWLLLIYLRTHFLAYHCNQLNNVEGEGDQYDEVTWSWFYILLKLKWSPHIWYLICYFSVRLNYLSYLVGGLNSKIFVKILEYIETQILCVHSPDGSIYDVVKKSHFQ